MADFTIPDLSAGTNAAATDLLEAYQGSAPSVKITPLQLAHYILNTGTQLAFNISLSSNGSITLTPTTNLILAGIPTADPHVVHAVWSNLGILTLSAG